MATPSLAMIPSGYKATKVYSVLPTDGAGDLTFSRTDGAGNGSATRVNESGLIELMGENVPRLDYTGGGCPSLLLEPQSTNLITYSEDFSNAAWGKTNGGVSLSPVLTSNYSVSPDGTINADRLIFDLNGGTTSSDLSQLQSSNFVMDDDYSNSIWLKSNTASSYVMSYLKPNGSATTITVTTEWQRFESSSTVSATTVPIRLRLRGGSESTDVYADISVYGAQLEQQSYATSYIPTAGATVSRIADSAYKTGLSSYINSSEGVLYAEIAALSNDLTNRLISLSDASSDNRVELWLDSTSNQIRVRTEVNNGTSIDITSVLTDSTTINKLAVRWDATSISLFINGLLIQTKTSTQFNADVLDKLAFSNHSGGFPFYGKTKDLRVYKTELTDAELTTLTTL